MLNNSYLRAIWFGSVIPGLLTALVFSGVILFGKQWLPLIALIVGMYALPAAIVATLLLSLLLLRRHGRWTQLLCGWLVYGLSVAVTVVVLEYNH